MSQLATLNHLPTNTPRASALNAMACRLQVEPAKLMESLKHTAFKGASNEEMLALVVVANRYGLNPFLKQLYAFPAKGGGIVPMVSIDGWAAIVNQNPSFDGVEFEYIDENGKPSACTCTMHVRGRSHPVKVTEYLLECSRNTEPWKMMPRRMLRHKAYMQAARMAFSLGGIYDEDEARDIPAGDVTVQEPTAPTPKQPRAAALADRLKAAAPIEPEIINEETGEVRDLDQMPPMDPDKHEESRQEEIRQAAETKQFKNFDAFRLSCIDLVASTDVTESQVMKWMGGQVIAIGKKGKEAEIPAEVLARWYAELKSGKAKL